MTTNNRPNYFILLDLDPKKPWSDAEFEKALKEKKEEWNKKVNHPQKGAESRKNRDMIPSIQSVMKNETERKKEAEAAIKLQQKNEQKIKEDFRQAVERSTIKGFITEDEIALLIKSYSSVTSETNLKKELKKKGIEIRETTINKTEPNDVVLASSVMKDIKTDLGIIQKKDLYDFLELAKSSRTSDLHDKGKQIYGEMQKYGTKTAEVDSKQRLTGYVTTIFKNDTERAKYDRALAEEAYSILEDEITIFSQRTNQIIFAAEFTYLLDKARARGLDVDKAANYIRQTAQTKRLAVQVTDVELVKEKLCCPTCDHLNDKTRESCSECNAPLKVTCPKCQQMVLIEERSCRCSFPVGNAPNVKNLISQGQRLIAEKNFEVAILNLNYAKQEWNTIPPIQPQDELTLLIKKYRDEAEGYQAKQKNLQHSLTEAIQSRCFYQARKLLYQLQSNFPFASIPAESTTIEPAIKEADAALSIVRTTKLSEEEAIARYQEILNICQDYASVKDILAKTPPITPTNLRANISNGLVSLNWQSSSAKNVKYTIIRKYNSRPISSNDGECLATINGLYYDDTKPAVGLPIYYAVYTNRAEVLSTSAALLDVPVLVVGEITNLVKQVSNQQINLQWNPPENAVEIRVIRNQKLPTHANDGEVVEVLNKSYLIDRNLQNGITYHYGIYAIFNDHQGKSVVSQGVFITAIPEEPPSVPKVHIEIIGKSEKGQLRLHWKEISKGEFIILKSLKNLESEHDTVLPESRLTQLGEILIGKQNNEIITQVKEVGVIYFTPVIIFQSMAYLGKSIVYTNLEEISNLKVQRQTNALNFSWDWPKNCQQAILSYSHVDFPSHPTAPNVIQYQVIKAEYDIRGYYSIAIPEKQTDLQDYFIVVFAIIQSNGQNITSPGLSSSARFRVCYQSQINLHYEIERKKELWKFWNKGQLTLILKISGTGILPNLILVSKSSIIPLNKSDGKSVLKISSQPIAKDTKIMLFPLDNDQPGYVRLFLEDDTLYDSKGGYIRIYHPSNEKLRID